MDTTVTVWKGTGTYSQGDKKILMIALRSKEVHEVIRIARKIDPEVFVTIVEADEFIGSNFNDIMLGQKAF